MKQAPSWIGTCVNLTARDLDAFDDSSREVTYRTFLKHVGVSVIHALNAQFGGHPTIKNDYHVQYYTGKWRGQPAACMMHSSIHHIWQL